MQKFVKVWVAASALFFVLGTVHAKEGMWLPFLLQQLNQEDMQAMGLKLEAEDIYSVNQSSLKDAVLIFGGGCTGELISDQGLVLTNHHCGYGRIQSHSSVEHDYLTDGFWAMDRSKELPNPGLTATFVVRMEDVTEQVLNGMAAGLSEADRDAHIRKVSETIEEEAAEGTHYKAEVRPFYHGNQFILIITETFKDVRLVGAPPSSIGKFGFDTDNWVWPRHTGDFSLFRIYADKDNRPAEYDPENVPYRPRHHFPINLKDRAAEDFTMVYGFPGRTEEYLPAVAVEYVLNKSNPAKIEMRDASLEIIGKAMESSKKINIQYAAKQSGISNAWKKWIGQSRGLKRADAVGKKRALETEFHTRLPENPMWSEKYTPILPEYEQVYAEIEKYRFAREMLIEVFYYGPELMSYASSFKALTKEMTEEEQAKGLERLVKGTENHFKDYHTPTDQALFEVLVRMYLEKIDPALAPAELREFMEQDGAVEKLYAKSMFTERDQVLDFLNNFKAKKSIKQLEKDDGYRLAQDFLSTYEEQVKPTYNRLQARLDSLNRLYMEALMTVLPNHKKYYPDANFSLRLTYGRIEGYQPADGVGYAWYTTAAGILEKMDTTTKEFDGPEELVSLIEAKDFGPYANSEGELPVCFIASNHTTGGNSGSPTINGSGELIGLNFDRTWESTMSDIMYDPSICRNIAVDIRYVLFIIDKFAGADHLIEELTLVKP